MNDPYQLPGPDIIWLLIYYGVGLSLAPHAGPAVFFPIAIVVYIIQVGYSHIWFRYFRYGPFEWVWRQLTYGKMLPLLK